MNIKLFFTCLFIVLVTAKTFAKKTDKELQTIDRVYEDNIKTVLLYPNSNSLKDATQPSIVKLGDTRTLLLSFDELGSETKNYYVKILNCNADWTESNLNGIMYLSDYNEYQIFDRQPSYNTRIAYIHYKFPVPKTKISGNFLIKVYREGDEYDLILTKRFMVYETFGDVSIAPQIKFPISNSERNTGQQLDFSISYSGAIINPMERLKIVLRQNYSWKNAIYDLKPAFMRDDIRMYDYTFFNNENVFKGGNEFRFFDLRSLRSNGMNISKIIPSLNKNVVLLGYDKSRKSNAYSTSFDINGFYAPEQYETKGYETDPDYAEVIFTLDIKKEDAPGRIFIMGALTDWSLNAAFEMKWDEEYKVFTCSPTIKQGYYNYHYTVVSKDEPIPDDGLLEGHFSQTQNVYDFIVYYRGPAGQYDRIIGYKSVDYLWR